MQANISIALTVPHMTKEKYSQETGIDAETIDLMLKDGRLSSYRHRLRKDGKRELILINVAALAIDALTSHEVKYAISDSGSRSGTLRSA
ncbi:hypothetical protein ACSST1_03005 [Pantoea agglomerans]|jgi:hypothetical protein|uniref:hypothetical protein n=1 Tax=Enterobacter agglomerans TaxID=549 RepID=UPI000DAEF717|nr:hypothetical protein [Pantoea agglomerans]MBD8153031.1 hypothetical protein [Pantoea agglomerans]RAH29152.1 hypothetical protein DOT37_15365 [Pantoea agglomerans]TGX90738.1 hypothetical protein E5821_16600 [Pantoea agglomerans]